MKNFKIEQGTTGMDGTVMVNQTSDFEEAVESFMSNLNSYTYSELQSIKKGGYEFVELVSADEEFTTILSELSLVEFVKSLMTFGLDSIEEDASTKAFETEREIYDFVFGQIKSYVNSHFNKDTDVINSIYESIEIDIEIEEQCESYTESNEKDKYRIESIELTKVNIWNLGSDVFAV